MQNNVVDWTSGWFVFLLLLLIHKFTMSDPCGCHYPIESFEKTAITLTSVNTFQMSSFY